MFAFGILNAFRKAASALLGDGFRLAGLALVAGAGARLINGRSNKQQPQP